MAASLLIIIFIIVRNVVLGSPIWGGDEYAYYIAGKAFPDTAGLYLRDDHLQQVNNTLFFWLVHLGFLAFGYAENFIKSINCLFFVLAGGIYFMMARRLSTPAASLAGLAVIALQPFSAYAAAVMPDMLYYLLSAALAFVMVFWLPERPLRAGPIAGVLLALLLLTKPHALSLVAAVLACICVMGVSPGGIRRRSALAAIFFAALTFLTTTILVKMALTGTVEGRIGDLLGVFYSGALHGNGIVWMSFWGNLARNLAAHLILLSMIAGPALSLAISHIVADWWRPAGDPQRMPAERYLLPLSLFLVFGLGGAVAMTAVFTAELCGIGLPDDWKSLYTRYYEFLLPLSVIMLMSLGRGANRGGIAAVRIGGGAMLLAALAWWIIGRHVYNVFPWNVSSLLAISDSAWGNKTTLPLAAIFSTVACLTGLATLLWPRRAFVFSLLSLSAFWAASSAEMTLWQYDISTGMGPAVRQARAIAESLSPDERDKGVIVGTGRWGHMDYSLFGFAGRNLVLSKEREGMEISSKDIPPGARWILVIGNFPVTLPVTEVIGTPPYRLLRLAPAPSAG